MGTFYRCLTIATLTTGMLIGTIPRHPANAADTIVCASRDNRYNFCSINTRGGVRLEERLSNNPCEYKEDWGYERDGIWVDNGCRASFLVGSRHSSSRDRDKKGVSTGVIIGGAIAAVAIGALLASSSRSSDKDKKNETKEITCSSDGGYNRCNVDTGNGVLLHRQLSEAGCWKDRTWGYDDSAIWVDKGCRAVFIVTSGS